MFAPWALIYISSSDVGSSRLCCTFLCSLFLPRGVLRVCVPPVADRLVVAGLSGSKEPLHNSVVLMASAPPFSEELCPELITQLMM